MAASQDVTMRDVGSDDSAHLADASLLEREWNEKYA